MPKLKSILDFYINSSIHVALAVVSLCYITCFEFGLEISFNLLVFIGLASVVGYNFVKYFGLAKSHYRPLSNRLRGVLIVSVCCILLAIYYALQLQQVTLLMVLGFGVVTFLYAIPLLSKPFFKVNKKQLRQISGLKIYIIAFVWTGVTVILPIIETRFYVSADVILTASQRFLFVVVLMLPFEIRDLNYDSLSLATIPQKIGVKSTKILGIVLVILIAFLEFFKDDILITHLMSLMSVLVITTCFLLYSKQYQTRYYSAFWVEAIPLFWLMLLLVF